MRIAGLIILAVIAADPVWAQQPPAAPGGPLHDSLAPLAIDKDALGVLLKTLSQQQPETDAPKGNSGSGMWQMLEAKAGPSPAVWLLNSSSGQLLFCAAELKNSPGITCYTAPALH